MSKKRNRSPDTKSRKERIAEITVASEHAHMVVMTEGFTTNHFYFIGISLAKYSQKYALLVVGSFTNAKIARSDKLLILVCVAFFQDSIHSRKFCYFP